MLDQGTLELPHRFICKLSNLCLPHVLYHGALPCKNYHSKQGHGSLLTLQKVLTAGDWLPQACLRSC